MNGHEAQDPLLGIRHRNYRLVSVAGDGSLSRVYKAHDGLLNRPVALKVTHAEAPEFAPLLLRREARILARLAGHPNVIAIYDGGMIHGRMFVALEYMPLSLESLLLTSPHGLGVQRALRIGCDIASALSHAHDRGVIHRDVKPGSILLDRADGIAKLTDFNLASLTDAASGMTSPGANGTPLYMSPEQKAGLPLNPSTDVYSLGITLAELMLGRGGITGDLASTFTSRLPKPITACLLCATAVDSQDRFVDGAGFLAVLQDLSKSSLKYESAREFEMSMPPLPRQAASR